MTEKTKRICILGGGFAGLYTALRLSQFPWEKDTQPEIILVDRQDRFLFSPLLYELVTGEMQTWEIAPPFTELLADTQVNFIKATVTGIDVEAKKVFLEGREDLLYDYLAITIGSSTALDLVPGAPQHAIGFRTLEDAYLLNERLRTLEQSHADKIRVAIVGGGYSGVELACKLADRLGEKGRLRLIEKRDSILSSASEFNRETAKKALEARKVWLDLETQIEQITAESISLEYKGQVDTIPVDIVLWTVGNQVSPLIKSLPLEHSQQGLLSVTNSLQTSARAEIFALGDIAQCLDTQGKPLPATAQVAFQQADYCAWNIWASLTGRPMLTFSYQPLGEMMTLGKDFATISGLGINLDGTLAHIARRLIYLYRLPTLKHQLNVGLNWITEPLLELFSP